MMTGSDDRRRRDLDTLLEKISAAEGKPNELPVLLEIWTSRRPEDLLWGCSPEPYRRLGRRFVTLGVAPVAREVASTGLEHTEAWKNDVFLRLILGLARARAGDPDGAQSVLSELRREILPANVDPLQLDEQRRYVLEELLGGLGRTYKDQALATHGVFREKLRLDSLDSYALAYRLTGRYWTGINVATLAFLGGDVETAQRVARRVSHDCESRLSVTEPSNNDLYWKLATLGEASLVLGELERAGECYRKAHGIAATAYGDLNSTRRHARWLLEKRGCDASLLAQWLPMPKVVVFAGHMIDRIDRDSERFPPRLAEPVKHAIRDWLKEQNALIGFSSAACGADILFQEALRELQGECCVVLPYERETFAADSVCISGRAENENWLRRYEKVLENAQVITASGQRMDFGGISYDYANRVLHGLAVAKAVELETEIMGLAVWDGRPGDGAGGTAGAVARWRASGRLTYQVNPSSADYRPSPIVSTGTLPLPTSQTTEQPDAARVMFMLFADAGNFSKLTETQVPLFVKHFLGAIAHVIEDKYNSSAVVRNTWGDGLYMVFDTLEADANCALDICELVNRRIEDGTWRDLGLPKDINIRIALHAGPVQRCLDPITRQVNYVGTHVSRAARLEPKTPPGQVYASEAFAALAAVERPTGIRCEYVKQVDWAKHYGTFPTYVVRRHS